MEFEKVMAVNDSPHPVYDDDEKDLQSMSLQSRRDKINQPRVARTRATLGT
jgi:hypothetical protein